jgi:hypothetical protein
MAVSIDKTIVPFKETRGRPLSDEHRALVNLQIGESFTSGKRRETLYQIARSIGVKVSIMKCAEGWRVWKKSHPVGPRARRAHRGLVKTA